MYIHAVCLSCLNRCPLPIVPQVSAPPLAGGAAVQSAAERLLRHMVAVAGSDNVEATKVSLYFLFTVHNILGSCKSFVAPLFCSGAVHRSARSSAAELRAILRFPSSSICALSSPSCIIIHNSKHATRTQVNIQYVKAFAYQWGASVALAGPELLALLPQAAKEESTRASAASRRLAAGAQLLAVLLTARSVRPYQFTPISVCEVCHGFMSIYYCRGAVLRQHNGSRQHQLAGGAADQFQGVDFCYLMACVVLNLSVAL